MTNLLLHGLWPGLATWVALYISDYALTLRCARLYAGGVRNTIVFEGSFEITPYYQRDIDSLKPVSRRFILALVLISIYLAALWQLTRETWPAAYSFVLGLMICVQLAIHVRHFRNLVMFRAIVAGDAVRGRIEYPRPFMLRMSAVELFSFAGLFLLLFLFTGHWFLLGGGVGCLATGGKHLRLSRKHLSTQPAAEQA